MELTAVFVLITLFMVWNWLRQRYYRQIMQGYMTRDYDAALEACTRAIRVSPRDGVLYHNRAIIHMEKGDYTAALADFEQVIGRNKSYVPAYLQRARLHTRMGDDEAALTDYAQALAIDPDFEQTYLLRSLTYARQGEVERALRDNQRAIERIEAELANAEAFGVYMNGGDPVPELRRQLAYAYANRGNIHTLTGNAEAALADYDLSLQTEPDDALLLTNRAEGYATFGHYDEAIADYAQARRLSGKEDIPVIATNITGSRQLIDFIDAGEAVARYGRGETDDALDLWARLLKVDTQFSDPDWVKVQLEWPDALVAHVQRIVGLMKTQAAGTAR